MTDIDIEISLDNKRPDDDDVVQDGEDYHITGSLIQIRYQQITDK